MSDFLLPVDDDELTQPFWEGCAQGELRMQRFTASGRYCWPPRPMDPVSRTLDYEWVPVSEEHNWADEKNEFDYSFVTLTPAG